MAQRRREDDMSVELLSKKFDEFASESRSWRVDMQKAVDGNSSEIKCLATHFMKYKPQLEEGLTRRKFWVDFWEERRKELITYTVKGGALTLFGLVAYALAGKAQEFIKSAVAKIVG